ncbi:MAG: hypothetical protein HKN87_19360 [Saprospiraceae bacterium]|nr:hypothetical protein [Saprospiraceae bacterium]
MQFLFPYFLVALATLAIPVIIHLFYFRRYKKVFFTNVRFLREIKEESSIRSRLKNLITLLCRLLAVACLVLAFAQPFLKEDDEVKKGKKVVSIFIDNSFSMASLSEDAPLLDEAKRKAEEIVAAYEASDRFQIISHDMSARQQRLISKEQALAQIDDVELTPEVNRLSRVFERQKLLLDEESDVHKVLYYLSDFQQNITDLTLADTTYEYNLLPMQAVIEQNVSIDSAWFDAPVQMMNKPNKLLVRLRNWSPEAAENIQLSVRKDGAVKPVGSIDVPGNREIIDTVYISVLRPGIQRVELKITDFPIQFDDTYFLSFEVKQQIQTLIVNQSEPNRYLDAALSSESFFVNLNRNVSGLDYAALNQYQLILLNELTSISSGLAAALKTYMVGGGNVVVFPSERSDLSSYNQFLTSLDAGRLMQWDTTPRTVNYVNSQEFVFNDVFESSRGNLRLPSSQSNFIIDVGTSGAEKLLGYRDGKSFLTKKRHAAGHLYLSAAPIGRSYSNLVDQAEVFVPMLYKMALSTGRPRQIAYTIGDDNMVEVENKSTDAEVIYKVGGTTTFIPGQQSRGKYIVLNMHDQVRQAGFYDVYLDKDEILHTLAFNSNRLESDPTCYPVDEIERRYSGANILRKSQLADLGSYIAEKDRGIILWKYCLILALIFLALETLVIRFWSV